MANDPESCEPKITIASLIGGAKQSQYHADGIVIHEEALEELRDAGTVEAARRQMKRAYKEVELAHRAFFDALGREAQAFLDAQAKQG